MSINKEEEKKILSDLYELDNKEMFVVLINFYQKIKSIRSDMVGGLNLLDEVADTGSEQSKEKLRKLILDNYNELPRATSEVIKEISNTMKE